MGTLISSLWVLTAAHCFITPSRNYVLHGTGGHSLAGRERRINRVIRHPKWDEQSSSTLNDIQLIELEPSSSLNLSQPWQYMHINSNKSFAYNNSNQRNAYLRVKGFGILELPQNNDVPIQGLARQLTYADLPLAKCSSGTPQPMLCTRSVDGCGPCHGDVGAPLYTVDKSAQVEVQVGILQLRPYAATNYSECLSTVSSTTEDRGVLDTLYTPLAPYVSWISSYVPEIRNRLISVPSEGLSSTNFSVFYNETTTPLSTPEPQYKVNVAVAVSIVGAVTFVLLIAVIYLVIRACIRRSKRREIEEYAENSFIDPGGRFADRNEDPFATIPSNTRLASVPRTNLASSQPESLWHSLVHVFGGNEGNVSDDEQRVRPVDSADLKGMNSSSTVSWNFGRDGTAGAINNGDVGREGRGRQTMGTVRNGQPVRAGRQQQAQQSSIKTKSGNENDVSKSNAHDIDDPPSWLHAAWERLRVFRPMSPSSSGNLNLNNGSGRLRRETTNRAAECLVEFEMEQPIRPLDSSSNRLFHDHARPSSGEVRATDVQDEVGAGVVNNNDVRMSPAAMDCMVEVEMERPRC